MTDLHPDQGYLPSLGTAADRIEEIAGWLEQSRSAAADAVAGVTAVVWSGDAAQVFLATHSEVDQPAQSSRGGYSRLAAAVRGYQAAMQALQDHGDDLRKRLAEAEDERDRLQQQVDVAATATLGGGQCTATGLLDQQLILAEARVAGAWAALDELKIDRRRLDETAAQQMLDAPGAGARMWVALAYAGDRPRPIGEVATEVAELAAKPVPTAEDYALIRQFLALHSSNPAAMAVFCSRLGPTGVTRCMTSLSTWDTERTPAQLQPLSAGLIAQLRSGLVTASTVWDDATAQQWGRGLIDAIAEADPAQLDHVRAVASSLLGGGGLNPQLAWGSFDRIEELRVQDPRTFSRVAPDGALFQVQDDLMGAIFGHLAEVPDLARTAFPDDASTSYWFGQRDWRADGFEGPAVLLDAIINSPSARYARATDPMGLTWTETMAFTCLAAERLGGNPGYRVGAVSGQASMGVARALATMVPECAAGIGQGVDTMERTGQAYVTIVLNGQLVSVPPMTAAWGNVMRLLGVATADNRAAATYQLSLGFYAKDLLSCLTAPEHPDVEKAKDLLKGIGGLYGVAYGASAYQAAHHQELVSDQRVEDLAWMSAIAGAVPGAEFGEKTTDYLVQVASGQTESVVAALDPEIVSKAQLRATVDHTLTEGNIALDVSVAAAITDAWEGIDPPYHTGRQTLTDAVHDGYDWNSTASTSNTANGGLKVTVVTEHGLEERDPGAMP